MAEEVYDEIVQTDDHVDELLESRVPLLSSHLTSRQQRFTRKRQKCIVIGGVVVGILFVTAFVAVAVTVTAPSSTTSTITTTTDTPCTANLSTTDTSQSTTTAPVIHQCIHAYNLSQPWRVDHDGSGFRPFGPHSLWGYACDVCTNVSWFRFTPPAGDRMLDTCPKFKSCGTKYPIWTNARMPTEIGVREKVDAYLVGEDSCADDVSSIYVIRCSWDTPHDFIYRNSGCQYGVEYIFCDYAFCGMSD